jgi:hypothetical protein
MNDQSPKPNHPSYQRYRRQRTTQIILPVVLAVVLCIALVVLINIATFQWNGDVARWAEISTMWIAIPLLVAGFLFFALLVGMIYLLTRLLGIAPVYTNKAQNFVEKLGIRVRLIADASVKPIIFLNGIGATIQSLFDRR